MRTNVAGQPLTRIQWLAVCCWVSGMQIQQTAYSLGITVEAAMWTIRRGRAKLDQDRHRFLVDPGPPPHQPRTGDTP